MFMFLIVIILNYAIYFQLHSSFYPFTVLKCPLILALFVVFLGYHLSAGEADRGVWGSCTGFWESKADGGMPYVEHGSLQMVQVFFSKATCPSVQATKPSLVIFADRKEWMVKTIGLGQV